MLKNAAPGKTVDFTVAGNGAIPREQQGQPGAQAAGAAGQGAAGADASASGNGGTPGGGIGTPINTPDPLSQYKWWILGGLGRLLAAAAAFLLRKPAGAPLTSGAQAGVETGAVAAAFPAFASPAAKNSQLLNALKEEMFALESEKINGTIGAEDYALR